MWAAKQLQLSFDKPILESPLEGSYALSYEQPKMNPLSVKETNSSMDYVSVESSQLHCIPSVPYIEMVFYSKSDESDGGYYVSALLCNTNPTIRLQDYVLTVNGADATAYARSKYDTTVIYGGTVTGVFWYLKLASGTYIPDIPSEIVVTNGQGEGISNMAFEDTGILKFKQPEYYPGRVLKEVPDLKILSANFDTKKGILKITHPQTALVGWEYNNGLTGYDTEYTIKVNKKEISFVGNQILGSYYTYDSSNHSVTLCINSTTILKKLGLKKTDFKSGVMIKMKDFNLAGKPAISEYVPISVSGSEN